jgi:hypothetical protein
MLQSKKNNTTSSCVFVNLCGTELRMEQARTKYDNKDETQWRWFNEKLDAFLSILNKSVSFS